MVFLLLYVIGQVLCRKVWSQEVTLHIFPNQVPIIVDDRRHELIHQRAIHLINLKLKQPEHEPQFLESDNRFTKPTLPPAQTTPNCPRPPHILPTIIQFPQPPQNKVLNPYIFTRRRPHRHLIAPLIYEKEDHQGLCCH